MTDRDPTVATLDDEHRGWHDVLALVNALTPDERQVRGYYVEPGWSVVHVVGHMGAWLAEAHQQLERIVAGTYREREVDIDAINAQLLDAMRGQSWSVTWSQANAARTMLLLRWAALDQPDAQARWWIRKAGPDHYGEHLPRLREWVTELVARRP